MLISGQTSNPQPALLATPTQPGGLANAIIGAARAASDAPRAAADQADTFRSAASNLFRPIRNPPPKMCQDSPEPQPSKKADLGDIQVNPFVPNPLTQPGGSFWKQMQQPAEPILCQQPPLPQQKPDATEIQVNPFVPNPLTQPGGSFWQQMHPPTEPILCQQPPLPQQLPLPEDGTGRVYCG